MVEAYELLMCLSATTSDLLRVSSSWFLTSSCCKGLGGALSIFTDILLGLTGEWQEESRSETMVLRGFGFTILF